MATGPGSAVPAYVQLAAVLREQIVAGQIGAGAPVPSEPALADEYGCSRETARKAVAILRVEGLVVTQRARGSFVAAGAARALVEVPAGAVVTARLPTAAERAAPGAGEGVPVLVVSWPGGQVMYDAARVALACAHPAPAPGGPGAG